MMLGMLELLEGSGDKGLARATAIAERLPNNLEMRFHRAGIAYLTDARELESLLAPLAEISPTNRLGKVKACDCATLMPCRSAASQTARRP
jgi:hypothetical protein